MSQLNRKARRRIKKLPVNDVGMGIARCLLVRALRQAGLHHAIAGSRCVVGIVVENAKDIDAFVGAGRLTFQRMLRESRFVTQKVMEWDGDGRTRRPHEHDADAAAAISTNTHIFGFVTDPGAFPATFKTAADGIVTISATNASAILAAARAVGFRCLPENVVQAVVNAPLMVLGAIIRPGRHPALVIRGLEQINAAAMDSAKPERPKETRLEDLHGLGDAAVWGRELAEDLKAYVAGDLSWSDIDRGVLVSGPTGTGKTTFATALARTCGVPIHVHSLARWQAKGYLNDLLKAMRGAFDAASKASPCILFIDELDSFGDRETATGRNENYVREVINGFLECLDGAESRDGVIVVGATNLPDVIDSAILRPGRLGKHIRIVLPDATARLGILKHHLRDDRSLSGLMDIAIRLEGASGAVIEQVVRDARRNARSERRSLTFADLEHGLPPRVRLSDADYRKACVHEAGHIVVGRVLAEETGRQVVNARVFREVTQNGDGGWTAFGRAPSVTFTKNQYLAQIAVLLAGIAAESHVYGEYSDGGGGSDDCDIRHATLIAATMHVSYGLGEDLVFVAPSKTDKVFDRIRADPILRNLIGNMLDACFRRAKTVIEAHSGFLDNVARTLIDHGEMKTEQIDRIANDTVG